VPQAQPEAVATAADAVATESAAAGQQAATAAPQSHRSHAPKPIAPTTGSYADSTAVTVAATPSASVQPVGGDTAELPAFSPQLFGLDGDSTAAFSLSTVPPRGEGGDPTAYAAWQNTAVGGTLIGCFLLIVYALSQSRGQISKIVRHIIDNRHNRSMTIASLPELRYMFLLMLCTAAECGLIYFNFTTTSIDEEALPTLPTVGIYAAVALVYIMAKGILFGVVNWTFFSREQGAAWTDVYVTMTAALGVALLPVAVAQTYTGVSAEAVAAMAAVAVGLQKLVSLRKAYDIFFSRFGEALHTLPYFVTLELLPIAALLWAWQECREMITMIGS